MTKKSILNDSADLYQKREMQSVKEKFKDLSFKDKIQYFKDYYLKIVLAFLFCGGCILWAALAIISPKEKNILSVVVINDYLDLDKSDTLVTDFGEYLGINKAKEKIKFDSDYYFREAQLGNDVVGTAAKIDSLLYTKQIDIIITDAKQFNKYASSGYFVNLMDYLPTDLYTDFSNSYYYSSVKDSKEFNPYGIHLTNCEKYENLGTTLDDPILGIVANSNFKDNSAEFIRYLYQ